MAAPFYAEKIAYFPLNTLGKDYVIGDVHGRYDLVYKALRLVNFNSKTDRLFCVGDLIDRGSDSFMVDEFLSEKCVYAIRGNHEDMLLELYAYGKPSENKLRFYSSDIGLEWWLKLSEEKRQSILTKLRALPLVAEVETVRGKVGLVHADITMELDWNKFKKMVISGEESVIEDALWSRTRLGHNIHQEVQGIGRVYVGHTVQEQARKLANVVAIDTGAVFDQHLTIAHLPVTTQDINSAPKPFGGVHVLQSGENELRPFGEAYNFN